MKSSSVGTSGLDKSHKKGPQKQRKEEWKECSWVRWISALLCNQGSDPTPMHLKLLLLFLAASRTQDMEIWDYFH